MYEEVTYDNLIKEMLDTAVTGTSEGGQLDTREGSMLWYGIAPAAAEIANLYTQLDWILDQSFADTASRPYLIRRAEERGITPYPANAAVIRAVFTPDTLELKEGTRFSLGKVNFSVTEKESAGVYRLTCETAGRSGNDISESLLPIEYVPGLETARAAAVIIPGDDEEETEHFRKRYFESLASQAYGGNVAQYKEWCMAVDGVGAVRVTPVMLGGGTVGIELLGSDMLPGGEELLEKVRILLSPEEDGDGLGLAPIGHMVLVFAPDAEEISVKGTLLCEGGVESAAANAKKAVEEYLQTLRQAWEDTDPVVRYAQMSAAISRAKGVIDVSGLTLNGGKENISCTGVPVPGAIVFTGSSI